MDTCLQLCGISSKTDEEGDQSSLTSPDGQANGQDLEPMFVEKVFIWLSYLITPYLRYCFHGAIILFYYLILTRFHLANGEQVTETYNILAILGTIPLMALGGWSHFVASGKTGLDPGYLEWEHFRDS